MGVWWALWSINEVLQGREGAELPRPHLRWVLSVIDAVKAEAEAMRQASEEAEKEATIRRLQNAGRGR